MSDKPKPASGKLKGVAKPESAFVMLELDLLMSSAWQGQSIYCRRLIDRLMVEHLRHAGTENGSLKISYDQFAEAGIARRFIKATLIEAEARGLLEIEGGQYRGAARTTPSKYRLTFLPGMLLSPLGVRYYDKATHEWRRFKPSAKSVSMGSKVTPVQFTRVNQTRVKNDPSQNPETQQNRQTNLGSKVTPPSISGGMGGVPISPAPDPALKPPSAVLPAVVAARLQNGGDTLPKVRDKEAPMAKDRRDRLTRELPLAPQKQPPPARSGSSQIDDDDKPKPKRKPTHHQTMSETRMLKMATMAAQAAGAQFATQEQFAELRRTVAKYGLVVEDVRRACRPNAYDTRPPSFGWVVRRAIEFADQRWRRKEKQREGRHGNY